MSTYNGENYIADQMESIIKQKGVSISLHIRDDGSKDSTVAIVKDFMKSIPILSLIWAVQIWGYKKKLYKTAI